MSETKIQKNPVTKFNSSNVVNIQSSTSRLSNKKKQTNKIDYEIDGDPEDFNNIEETTEKVQIIGTNFKSRSKN